MLPPGHASAGYVVATGVLFAAGTPLNSPEFQGLLWYGFFMGALPDIDMFAAFLKTRSLVIENQKQSHRAYVTHTPLFWLLVSSGLALTGHDLRFVAITLLAPLSHLLLDSIEDTICWLWPISKRGMRIIKRREDLSIPSQSFFSYWKKFLLWYCTKRTITAVSEAVIIMCFLLVLFLV